MRWVLFNCSQQGIKQWIIVVFFENMNDLQIVIIHSGTSQLH